MRLPPGQFSRQIQKRFLEVVVGLCGDLVVLQVLLAVERHLLRFHLTVLHIHFVAAQHDGDVFAHSGEGGRCRKG